MSAIEKAITQIDNSEKLPLAPALNKPSLAESVAQKVAGKTVVFDLGPTPISAKTSAIPVQQPELAEVAPIETRNPAREISLPLEKMAELGYVSLQDPRGQISEEYRSIKRPLLIRAEQSLDARIDNANVLMVTSSIQGEGKTFSAINLALSIAMERDKTVLFVDTDLVTASASHVLGLTREDPGLTDFLTGKFTDIADIFVHTQIPNLRVLPAGKSDDHAAELLSSANMKRLVVDLSSKYPDRIIVLDTPPILQTNEARILATLAGQIVFVVAANATSQSNVTEALSHLNKDVPVGLLLNRSIGASNDGYGYNYDSYAASTG